jgi:hypothetical protein
MTLGNMPRDRSREATSLTHTYLHTTPLAHLPVFDPVQKAFRVLCDLFLSKTYVDKH